MQPGEPSRALFPKEQWARSLRRAARLLNGGALSYEHTSGLPELQRVLAQYLAQERGVVCSPEQVLAFPTTQSALSLMTQCFSEEGDVALLEEPGYLARELPLFLRGCVCSRSRRLMRLSRLLDLCDTLAPIPDGDAYGDG